MINHMDMKYVTTRLGCSFLEVKILVGDMYKEAFYRCVNDKFVGK